MTDDQGYGDLGIRNNPHLKTPNLDQMAAEETGDLAESLGLVQTRLDLAATALPDDPEAAARDLNTAWEALDAVLTTLLEEVSEAEIVPEGE